MRKPNMKGKDKAQRGMVALNVLMEGRKEITKEILPKVKNTINTHRNELQNCPMCNNSIQDRTESIYRELIESLYRVYKWCGMKKKHEFRMMEIKHLLGHSDYSRFGNLRHYGGIVYKPVKGIKSSGQYGINMKRAKEFFQGLRSIPMKRVISRIDGNTVAETRVTIKDIPGIVDFLNEDGNYDHEFEPIIEDVQPSPRGLPLAYKD